MAEVIGLVASAVNLTEFAGEVLKSSCKCLLRVLRAIRNAPEDVRNSVVVLRKFKLIKTVQRNLKDLMPIIRPSQDLIDYARTVLRESLGTMTSMKHLLDKHGGPLGLWGRIRVPKDRSIFAKYTQRLDHLKNDITSVQCSVSL